MAGGLKTQVSELAIFGGRPQFDQPLHVGQPNIGNKERFLARMGDLVDRRWLTNAGPLVREFERRVAAAVGVKHCIATCNGTVALEIAIRALGLRGEVIVPSFTFIATAHALQWQEITPVFCDIDPIRHTIEPAEVERLITPRTSGMIGVHVWGHPCDVDALEDIARRRGLELLFDASHAFACSWRGRAIGGFGRAEVFSFHATKFVSTGEGGAIVTNDDSLADRARLMKNFGFSGYDRVVSIGTNGKMGEMAAALGLTNLDSLDDFIGVLRRNYNQYARDLQGLAGLRFVEHDEKEQCNYQYVVMEVDARTTAIARDDVVEILWAENALARRYFYPGCHRMEPYCSFFPHAGLLLPRTEAIADRILVLPTGTAVGEEEVSALCAILRLVLTHGADVSRRLAARRAPQS